MALPAEPPPTPPNYRLVVTASQVKAKQFVWVIVDDTNRGAPVQTSKQTFRSMEDAYNAGRGALEYWRAKMHRTTPAGELAELPPNKSGFVRGTLTSRIYRRG